MADNNDPWAEFRLRLAPSPGTTPAPQNQPNSDSWADYRPQAPTLAGNIPSIEETEENITRRRMSRDAAERFRNLTPDAQFMAGARHVASRMPFVRSFVGSNRDVEDFRTGLPRTSQAFGVAGQTLPYAGLAAAAPKLFSGVISSPLSSGAIEAADARIAGENPATAFVRGAASGIPGPLVSRAITPRTREGVAQVAGQSLHDSAGAAWGRQLDINLPTPSFHLSHLKPELENVILANVAGFGLGTHPIANTVAGLSPAAYRAIRNYVRTRERRGALYPLRKLPAFRNVEPSINKMDDLIFRYGTNQVLSRENRAIFNAISAPVTQEYADDTANAALPLLGTLTGVR